MRMIVGGSGGSCCIAYGSGSSAQWSCGYSLSTAHPTTIMVGEVTVVHLANALITPDINFVRVL